MGRRDAVQVILEVVAECRRLLPSLIVSYEPGWERRGNGTSANYEGGIVHHTASNSSLARPFPTQTILRDGRPGLSGPLCNFGGPACTVEAPRLHVVAAHPGNHAGASGGKSMGPLPVTGLFNPRVLGLEIDYSGMVPMMAGQLLVGHVWTKAVANILARGNVEYVRAHFETSITGKIDVSWGGAGKSYNMADWRRAAAALTPAGDDDMPLTDKDVERVAQRVLDKIMFDFTDDSPDGGGRRIGDKLNHIRIAVDDIRRDIRELPAAEVAAAVQTIAVSDADAAKIARLVLDGMAGRMEA